MTTINDENATSKQLKIMFCLPGTTFSHNFLKSWTSLIMWCFYNNIKIFMSNFQSSNVYYVRNLCLRRRCFKKVKIKNHFKVKLIMII